MRRWGVLAGVLLCGLLLGSTAGKDHEDTDNDDDKWKVLLVMIDGCRWDYVTEDEGLNGFKMLAENGVKAEYVQPVYPSNSYPNWYSIVTGLYSESHGFIDNEMYNESAQELFLMIPDPNATNLHWWDGAVPIWVTAESEHLRTALYWWGGCEVNIHGKRPRLCLPHADWHVTKETAREKLEEIVDAFEDDELDLAQFYYGHVDHFGHNKGPNSKERKHALKDIDDLLLEVQENLTDRALADKVNIVVVSDHGMTATGSGEVTLIDLNRFSNDIKLALGGGSRYWLLPFPGRTEKLYLDLKEANIVGIDVYRKDEIPEKYHVKNNDLVLPILIQAHEDYAIVHLSDERKQSKGKSEPKTYPGNHGYDPFEVTDMRTIFFARGPAFKTGYVSPPLQNVDHYNLLCHLLDMKSLPNNGSWERVVDMLEDDDDDDDYDNDSGVSITPSKKSIFAGFTVLLFVLSR